MKQRISDEHYKAIWVHTLVLLGKIFLITVPIALLSIFGGRYLDAYFGTFPKFVLLCGAAGLVLVYFPVSKAAKRSVSDLMAAAKESEVKEEQI